MAALVERRGRPQALTQEQVQRAMELRKQGKSFDEIGQELGVSGETVRLYLKKYETEEKAPFPEIAENFAKKRSQRDHFLPPISRLATEEKAEEQPAGVPEPTFGEKGIRPITEALGVLFRN